MTSLHVQKSMCLAIMQIAFLMFQERMKEPYILSKLYLYFIRKQMFCQIFFMPKFRPMYAIENSHKLIVQTFKCYE